MYIETQRLIIRDLKATDRARRFKTIWQKDVVRFMGDWAEHNKSEEDTARFIEWRRSQIDSADIYENMRYAVALKERDMLIGIVGTGLEEDLNEVEMAYFLDEEYRGNGYITEAVTALAADYFGRTEVPYVILTIDCANAASTAVARRCGFELYEKRTPIGHRQPNMESDSYFYYRKYR